MAKSELQELYERSWHQKRALESRQEPSGHYCVFLGGTYVAHKPQEACRCRPSRYKGRKCIEETCESPRADRSGQ